MTVTTDLTDRDRLVLALDELRCQHGYWVPNPSDLEPGPTLALVPIPDATPYVTWHAQSDDVAFGCGWVGADSCYVCHEHCDRLSALVGDTEDLPAAFLRKWAGDTDEQFELDQKTHIAEAHQGLESVLNLMWWGDASLICEALRRHGLDAREPEDWKTTIAVLPADPRGWPHWAACDCDHPCIEGHHHAYKPVA